MVKLNTFQPLNPRFILFNHLTRDSQALRIGKLFSIEWIETAKSIGGEIAVAKGKSLEMITKLTQ